jgi:hypothetical protein
MASGAEAVSELNGFDDTPPAVAYAVATEEWADGLVKGSEVGWRAKRRC